jgi:hypothetical protein
LFSVFRSGLAPTIDLTDGTFVVRFADVQGVQHSAVFHSRAAAKAFAREVRRHPANEPFDPQEVARLAAEFTGSLSRAQAPRSPP